MKYRLIRNDIRPQYPGRPLGWVPDEMQEHVETREVFANGKTQQLVYWKQGVEFDNEWGPLMVKAGVAEPADEECRLACERTPEQIAAAQKAYERTRLGIHPEDFDAYEKRWMNGYMPDGSWIPGENHAEYLALQEQEEEDEDE